MNKNQDSGLKDWAYFRFSVIGRLLARPPDKGQLKEQLEELAQKPWRHPITGNWIALQYRPSSVGMIGR